MEEGKDPSSSPPATMVLFPDLLPAENVVLARRSGAGAGAGGEPDAVWGAEDVVRAVIIPQDASSRLRTHATLDLALAAASLAAAAAERAAEMGDVDRWVRQPSPERTAANGGFGGFGGGDKEEEGGKGEDEDDAGATMGRSGLVLEAVSALLGCARDSVAAAGMLSHGMDLFFCQEAASPPPLPSLGGGGGTGGGSRSGSGSGLVLGETPRSLDEGGATNERASGLAGRRIVGDAVVVLVGGGTAHGAAGSGDVDGDGEWRERGSIGALRFVVAGVLSATALAVSHPQDLGCLRCVGGGCNHDVLDFRTEEDAKSKQQICSFSIGQRSRQN